MIPKMIFSTILAIGGLTLAAESTVLNQPYGICTHVSRAHEWPFAERNFHRMQEGNISWARTDFDWSGIDKKGEWSYDHIDKMRDLAKKENINILPILGYDIGSARPAWKHLDRWAEYVRRTVSRYSNDYRYWEVWNEPNLHLFWGDTPSSKNYTALLKRSYEEIKKIDPNLNVLYGGTAGVPFQYIEDSYAAGAGNYFDVMAIHPYPWWGTPEMMIPNVPKEVTWARFHITGTCVLAGFVIPPDWHGESPDDRDLTFDKNTFYVVFLDQNHDFFPTRR